MTHRPVLLVVDDAPLFRELETLCLVRLGIVVEARSGAEALEAVRRHRPDLVLLDLTLPDLDGALVCREITRAPGSARIPVIAVGTGDAEGHARAVDAGAADVLAKPLSRDLLLAAVRRFVGGGLKGLPRVPVETPVRVRIGAETRLTLARNLSRGGMFLETGWSPPPDREMELSFVLPESGAGHLKPRARIIWHRPGSDAELPGFGVRFLGLDRESDRTLDTWVHERTAQSPGRPAAGGHER